MHTVIESSHSTVQLTGNVAITAVYRESVASVSQYKLRILVTDSRCNTPELVLFASAHYSLVLIY